MKGFKKILLLFVMFGLVLTLAGCSNFSSVKKAMEKDGWSYVENGEEDKESTTITAELEEGNISCTLHTFKKPGTILIQYVFIIEFASDKDLDKAFAEGGSETLKGLIKDAQNSDYVNGTCVLIPTPIKEAVETFKNAK